MTGAWQRGVFFISTCMMCFLVTTGCINQGSNESNHPPVVNFTYYLEGATLHCIDFSSDKDNDNLVYVWDFGDDSFATEKIPVIPIPSVDALP